MEWFLPENLGRRNSHTSYWGRRQGRYQDLSQMAGVDYGKLVKVEPLAVDDADPLRSELESFVRWVQTGSPQNRAPSGQNGLMPAPLRTEQGGCRCRPSRGCTARTCS